MSFSPVHAPLRLTEVEQFLLTPELGGDRERRLAGALAQIALTGTYEPTTLELAHGTRLAWRNHFQATDNAAWRAVRVLDRRDRTTGDDVIAELVDNLTSGFAFDRIRPTVTVFAPGWRVHNEQLVRFAGWTQPDGTVLGDPRAVATTNLATSLGWTGPDRHGAFDLLPIILSGPGHPPRTYDLPTSAVLEVPLHHPHYPWFTELGLSWHVLPTISNMSLALGGLTYSLAPFTSRHSLADTGSRDLRTDDDRDATLTTIARRLRLDTSEPPIRWRTKALTELDTAIRSSFAAAGVTLPSVVETKNPGQAGNIQLTTAGGTPPDRATRDSPAPPTSGNPEDPALRPRFFHHEQPPPTTSPPSPRQIARGA